LNFGAWPQIWTAQGGCGTLHGERVNECVCLQNQQKGHGVSKPQPDLRRLGIFLFLGAVVGAGFRYYLENQARATEVASPSPLINWPQARKIALKVSKWEEAPLQNAVLRQQQYADWVAQSEPLIAEYLGVKLPQPLSRVYVVDRRQWLEANFTSFTQLFKPLEALYQQNSTTKNPLNLLFGDFKGVLLGSQMGFLLGFLAQRVLGQYDLSLFSPQPEVTGALYYVEPNIARIQTQSGLNDEDFRFWIALHETTHAFEFEAYPWVREHFHQLLNNYFAQLESQMDLLGGLPAILQRVTRNFKSGKHWVELVLTPEQLQIFEQLQALMSLAEGYSNHIMNVIGRRLLPTFDQIEHQMAQRQKQRPLIDQVFFRLTGMDLKLAQYQQGEAFVNAVVTARGIEFASKAWGCAENLPTLGEIRQPQQWIERMEQS